jgi:hypothetical protein
VIRLFMVSSASCHFQHRIKSWAPKLFPLAQRLHGF